jgi:hypothetical protein
MLRLRHALASSLSLIVLTSAQAQQAPAANPLRDLLTMQMNWDASKSSDTAAPAVPLGFVPWDKHKQDAKTFTSYYLYAPGLQQNTPYTLVLWQIGWDAQQPPMQSAQSGIYVNARGVVMCRKPTEKENNSDAPDIDSDGRVNIITAGSAGEPVRYALYDEKAGMVAMGRLIVNPIQSDDHGCHLQAILAIGGAQVVLVEGTGFPSKSSVQISTTVGGRPQSAAFVTDEKGRLETAVVLMRQGETQGASTITMQSASCAPAVKVNWGPGTYHVQ